MIKGRDGPAFVFLLSFVVEAAFNPLGRQPPDRLSDRVPPCPTALIWRLHAALQSYGTPIWHHCKHL